MSCLGLNKTYNKYRAINSAVVVKWDGVRGGFASDMIHHCFCTAAIASAAGMRLFYQYYRVYLRSE